MTTIESRLRLQVGDRPPTGERLLNSRAVAHRCPCGVLLIGPPTGSPGQLVTAGSSHRGAVVKARHTASARPDRRATGATAVPPPRWAGAGRPPRARPWCASDAAR